jgi:hypothetical protein
METIRLVAEEPHSNTMYGLHKWYDSMFKKVGWVITCGDKDKKEWYLKSARHLKDSLKDSLSEYTENDRKHDIVVMWNKTNKLIKYIEEFNKLSIDKVEQIDPMSFKMMEGGARKKKVSKKISRPVKKTSKNCKK